MPKQRFEEIDVQRVNVVDADGTLRMTISNKDMLPNPVLGGKELERQGPKLPGIIFFNDDGDECGGLLFGGSGDNAGSYWAGMHLSYDQFGNDQVLVLAYDDENGRRSYGLSIYDRPEKLPDDFQRVSSMQEGPEKTRLWRELQDKGAFGFSRMFFGRNTEGEPTITLNDSRGRQRLRLRVGTDDTPRVELLDEQGETIYTLPPTASQTQDQIADLQRQILELQREVQHLAGRTRT